jgi:hypothetical protein
VRDWAFRMDGKAVGRMAGEGDLRGRCCPNACITVLYWQNSARFRLRTNPSTSRTSGTANSPLGTKTRTLRITHKSRTFGQLRHGAITASFVLTRRHMQFSTGPNLRLLNEGTMVTTSLTVLALKLACRWHMPWSAFYQHRYTGFTAGLFYFGDLVLLLHFSRRHARGFRKPM